MNKGLASLSAAALYAGQPTIRHVNSVALQAFLTVEAEKHGCRLVSLISEL